MPRKTSEIIALLQRHISENGDQERETDCDCEFDSGCYLYSIIADIETKIEEEQINNGTFETEGKSPLQARTAKGMALIRAAQNNYFYVREAKGE